MTDTSVAVPAASGAVSSLERAVRLVRAVAQAPSGGIGVTAAAQASGLPKAASHRILKSLTALGVVSFDDGTKRYTLGPASLAVGLAALRQLDVPRLAQPHLERLVAETRETATLSMRQGSQRVYLAQLLSPQEVKMTVRIGEPFPLHAGASSRAILSTFDDRQLEEYLGRHRLEPVTELTITDPERLRSELEEVRMLGYAVTSGQRQRDAASVAAPVLQADGTAFGALSVCGPAQRFDRNGVSHIGRLVRAEALALSRQIGYEPPA